MFQTLQLKICDSLFYKSTIVIHQKGHSEFKFYIAPTKSWFKNQSRLSVNLNDQNLKLSVTYLRFITLFRIRFYTFSGVFSESTVCGVKFCGGDYPKFFDSVRSTSGLF